ncbi:hypothetical protein BX070DRAFT_229583 [Coemansia spiralis]|nr:hypothetical protein BX070DRAFT_229583 [Coemansia spiralis]
MFAALHWFNAIILLFASACFLTALIYDAAMSVTTAPAVAKGVSRCLYFVFAALTAGLAIAGRFASQKTFPILKADNKDIVVSRMLLLFHATFGVFIISDSAFMTEREPHVYPGNTVKTNIAKILFPLMIAGVAAQGLGVLLTFVSGWFSKK